MWKGSQTESVWVRDDERADYSDSHSRWDRRRPRSREKEKRLFEYCIKTVCERWVAQQMKDCQANLSLGGGGGGIIFRPALSSHISPHTKMLVINVGACIDTSPLMSVKLPPS